MFKKIAAGVLPLVATGLAMAQAAPAQVFDASSATTQVTSTIAGLLAVGGAVFAVVLAIKSTKWARRAL